jgi:hypothetical protein
VNPLEFIGWQRFLVYGALVLAIAAFLELDGFRRGEKRLFEYQAEQARAAVKVITRIERVKEEVRVPYLKREVQIQTVYVPIEKEAANVPSRSACNVTRGWVRVHDAAAGDSGRIEGAVDDAADSGIAEARAAEVVTGNYRRYHQVANDLTACRAFVGGLKRTTEP